MQKDVEKSVEKVQKRPLQRFSHQNFPVENQITNGNMQKIHIKIYIVISENCTKNVRITVAKGFQN